MTLVLWNNGTSLMRSPTGILRSEECCCGDVIPPGVCNVCSGTVAPGAFRVTLAGIVGTGANAACADAINGTYIVPFFTDAGGVCSWCLPDTPSCARCNTTGWPGGVQNDGSVEVSIAWIGGALTIEVLISVESDVDSPATDCDGAGQRWLLVVPAGLIAHSCGLGHVPDDCVLCCDIDELELPTTAGVETPCFLDAGVGFDFSGSTCFVTALGC